MRTKLPIKKSENDIISYKKNGKMFGSILKSIYEDLRAGELKSGKEISSRFINHARSIEHTTFEFPFQKQENSLGNKFYNNICVSVNDMVAHGVPNYIEFKTGDIISVDFGLGIYDGVCSRMLNYDSAFTVAYNTDIQPKWVKAPQKALRVIVNSNYAFTTKQVAAIISNTARRHDLNVVTQLTGHGIGYNLHEEPMIRNMTGAYVDEELFEGLVFCAEPIFALPKEGQAQYSNVEKVYLDSDGWSIKTISGQPTSHFETMFCIHDGELVDLCNITEWQL